MKAQCNSRNETKLGETSVQGPKELPLLALSFLLLFLSSHGFLFCFVFTIVLFCTHALISSEIWDLAL